MNAPDTIKATVLPDGTIKLETDRISAANHVGAEGLVRAIYEAAGGKTTRTRKGHSHAGHTHSHDEEAHTHG